MRRHGVRDAKNRHSIPALSGSFWLALTLTSLLAACAAPARQTLPRLTPSAERIFHADPRWLGGDAAISVDLGDHRILWLFGDSFVDPTPPYRRREAAFIHNSVAVQSGVDPAAATMTFAWRVEDGAPAAFFPNAADDWFWPGSGVKLDNGALAIFLNRIRQTDEAPPLGFESVGYALALVENPDDPPAAWRVRIVPGPPLPFDALPGLALVREGDTVTVLAIRTRSAPAGMLVRYSAQDLAAGDLSRGLWWSGRSFLMPEDLTNGGPAVVLADAGAESSLQPGPCGYVQVTSLGFGASVIVARTAPALTGPWSAPEALLKPPESAAAQPFVYAGRAHAALPSAPGVLVVSYVANSFQPDALMSGPGESALYWPRLAEATAPSCPRPEP